MIKPFDQTEINNLYNTDKAAHLVGAKLNETINTLIKHEKEIAALKEWIEKDGDLPDWLADMTIKDYRHNLNDKIEALRFDPNPLNDPFADGYCEGRNEVIDRILSLLETES